MKISWSLICVYLIVLVANGDAQSYAFSKNESSLKEVLNVTAAIPPDTLIVGGVPALKNEFPFLLNLRIDGALCGGALIALDTVLTAAHCVLKDNGMVVDPSKIVAVAGDHIINQNDGTEQNATGTRIRIHENYNPNRFINDIALIKLQRNFTTTPNGPIRAINLPQSNANITGNSTHGTVAGWGTTREGGQISYQLMKVQVPLVTNQSCASQMTYSSGQFCAGDTGKDSCQGDSGGPILCSSNPTVVCGIVSYGDGCGRPNKPGVYTKISWYITWINANIKFPPGTGYEPTTTTTEPSSGQIVYPISFTMTFITAIMFLLYVK